MNETIIVQSEEMESDGEESYYLSERQTEHSPQTQNKLWMAAELGQLLLLILSKKKAIEFDKYQELSSTPTIQSFVLSREVTSADLEAHLL